MHKKLRAFALAALLLLAASGARAANLIDDSSFEAGAGNGWGVAMGAEPSRVSWNSYYDSTTAVDGRYSLKIPTTNRQLTMQVARSVFTIETKYYRLTPGRKYTLSLYMKADKPCAVEFGLLGHGPSERDAKGRAIQKPDDRLLWQKAQLETGWKRYSVSGEPAASPGGLAHLSIDYRTEDLTPINVWIDAVQLEEGELSAYAPRLPVEIGFRCPVPGNIYYETEPARLKLLVYNAAGRSGTARINYSITDLFDREVEKGTLQADLAKGGKNLEIEMAPYIKRRGIFRLLAWVDEGNGRNGQPVEMTYSVLPPNKHLNEPFEGGLLGTDVSALRYDQLQVLKRANFNWILSKKVVLWDRAEPTKGDFRFYDEEIEAARKAGVVLVGQLLWGDGVAWSMKNLPAGDLRKPKVATWDETARAQFLKDVAEYTTAVVSHYKGKIKYYELTNEPYFQFTPEQVGEVYRTMYQAAKKADPNCVCAINTDYRLTTDEKGEVVRGEHYYLPQTVEKYGLNICDVVSAHFYINDLRWFLPFGNLLKKYGKPGWNTETGITCASFYKTLPLLAAIEQGDAFWKNYLRTQVIPHADSMQKNVLLTISAGQMDKYFYYFSRFGNCSPSQPTRRAGSGKENVEFDGSLRAGGVTQSIASHFFEGCQYDSRWIKDPRIEMYLFRDGTGTRGFMYAAGTQPKPLLLTLAGPSRQMEFYDLMSNPVGLDKESRLPLTFLVKFFKSSLPPQQAMKAMEEMKIEEGKIPAEGDVWSYDDFEMH
ncbi:MAG TPA: endo-1,4-beta-xylanase [bacterium]|uniref:Glycosyl hydrolase family 10 n=1 Tax=candidate division TA06 bacterium ADurb.Bin417 TaxID=1852828 RepID=A0A1V5MI62_UNCT6|nr:MAG: Glycosyl hydrolase family 10 [candidate division TA06 bacterium ADurb.Bin417]HNQ35558.1 endo-1,4-beta-xylanase [bacterium]HNS48824.1 endo-1,4-beta-xylanase [bacterium]